MATKKVEIEAARSEITKWLDWKKIFKSTREAQADSVELLAEAMSEGYLILNDKMQFEQTLAFPNEEAEASKVIKYRARLTDRDLVVPLTGVKSDDAPGRLNGYCVAMTGESKGVIAALDSLDKKVMMAIVIFFI